MIRTDDKNKCSGCGTCALVCPKHCIEFEEDAIGAKYPVIDANKCINCGLCENVCPIQKGYDNYNIGNRIFASYAINPEVRKRGSSGGMFELIGELVLDEAGSVFASKFDENLKLRCIEAKTESEIKTLTKSKYLQSDCSSMFPIIKQRVKEGKKVLFCSTPCQVSALKNYLGKMSESENLYLLDFFCHGVPSQSFFDKCRELVEKKCNIIIKSYQFRTKIKNGATPHYYTLKYEKNGKIKEKTQLYLKDPFYLGFQKYLTLRDSCYHCPFGKGNHAADLTIGDFHEIDRYIKGINRFDGVSTVIINNDKGEKIWEAISRKVCSHELDIRCLKKDSVIYSGGTKEPKQRKEFLKDINMMEFPKLVDKWFDPKKEWKKEVYYLMPTFMRKIMKKIMGL